MEGSLETLEIDLWEDISLKLLKTNTVSIGSGDELGLERTDDIRLQIVSVWTALTMEDRSHDTPSLFTP